MLMSAIALPFHARLCGLARAFVLRALGGMEPRIAPIGFGGGPIRRHPARPAELAETAEPDRRGIACRDRQLGIPLELLAGIEKHEIGQRLAQVPGRQKANVLGQVLGEYPNPDLVLNAEDVSAE